MNVNRDQVSQRRLEGAVAGVGVIERGFSTKLFSTRLGLDGSRGKASQDKSLNTDSSSKIGHVSLKKCTTKTSAMNKLFAGTSRSKGDVSCCKSTDAINKKTLLHPMKVNIPQESITAILGTSESGKSTFLKFLAGCPDNNVDCEGVGE